MKKRALHILLLVLTATALFSLPADAQSVRLNVASRVIEGQRFVVSITVTNGEANITRSDAPQLAGCTFYAGPGVSTMYSQQIVNGRQSSSVSKEYSFTYIADKAGTVTVPPIKVVVDGKVMQTQSRSFTILPADRSQQQRGSGGMNRGFPSSIDEMEELMNELMNQGQQSARRPQQQPQQQQQQLTNSKISPNDFIITVNLSKKDIYEKEAVIATIKLYTKHNVTKFQPVVMPQFEGFLSEEIDVTNQKPVLENFRGENYYTVVLKKCLLYPQKSGTLKINSGTYDVTLETVDYVTNGYYATPVPKQHNITTTSNSVSVSVKPLPTPAPPSFNGAVGNFEVSASIAPAQLRTNEAARYVLTVRGTGNLKHLAEPIIPLPATVEEYTPSGESDARFNGSNMQGSYTATYTFIPQVVGKLDIPAWDYTYFNPATGQYVTTRIQGFSREVVKGVASSSSSGGKDAIDTEAIQDIRHIHKVNENDLRMRPRPIFDSAWYWLAYILCLGALLAAVVLYRRHLKSMADIQGRRIRRARSVASKRLAKASTAMKNNRTTEFYEALSAALWGFLSDKLKIAASALTRDNVAEKLIDAGATEETVNTTIRLLDDCEMARFTPHSSQSEMESLYREASEVIDSLNRLKPVAKVRQTYASTHTRYS